MIGMVSEAMTCSFASGEAFLVRIYSSSGGTTSAGGIGRPRAAAIN